MEILEIPEKPSWTTYLAALEVGEYIEAPASKYSTIRPRISGKIKDLFPTRVYSTDTETKPGKIIVTRTA